jgi:hypothetical protein
MSSLELRKAATSAAQPYEYSLRTLRVVFFLVGYPKLSTTTMKKAAFLHTILFLAVFNNFLFIPSKAGIKNPDGSLNGHRTKTIAVGDSLRLDGVGVCAGSYINVTNVDGTARALKLSKDSLLLNGCKAEIITIAEMPGKSIKVELGGLSDLDSIVAPVLSSATLSLVLDDFLLNGDVVLHLYGNGSAGTGTLIEYYSPFTNGTIAYSAYNNFTGWSVDQTFNLGPLAGYDESDFGWSSYGVLKSVPVPVPGPAPLLGVSAALGYTRKIRSRILKFRTLGGEP